MDDSEVQTITKRDLVQRIADNTGQTKVLVRDVIQRFLDEISLELIQGNRLEFRKFGVFEVRSRPGRVAQNPKTLDKVIVPAKRVVKFKVGNVLKKRVEDGDASGLQRGPAPTASAGNPDPAPPANPGPASGPSAGPGSGLA
ncbi:MAG: integration host factor subunit beta [Planctomycetota bacterium]|nr:MAG: integration host factor subunit beta [Planctomycetota bacterium]